MTQKRRILINKIKKSDQVFFDLGNEHQKKFFLITLRYHTNFSKEKIDGFSLSSFQNLEKLKIMHYEKIDILKNIFQNLKFDIFYLNYQAF